MAVGGVEDEHVRAGLEQRPRAVRRAARDAERRRDAQAALGVGGRRVDGGAQRPAAGEDAGERAVGVHDGREAVPAARVEEVERLPRRDPDGQGEQLAGHDRVELGEAVDARAVGLRHDADRAAALDDDDRAVRALGQQRQRLGRGRGGLERDRGVVDEVARLHPGDDLAHDVDGDVLRDDGEAAAPRDRLGHAPAGDGGHVRGDDGDRRPGAVGGREIDVQARGDVRAAGDEEDVVVGRVREGRAVVQEPHVLSRDRRTACSSP